jgi:NAD(P)-dependent dehydrogenase (short-subunit alcohol dehydrogenase family)
MTQPNPIAIVTGGSRGLGRSTVLNLAKRGVRTVFTYNSNEAEARNVARLAHEAGADAIALQFDASNVASFDAFVARVRDALGTFGALRVMSKKTAQATVMSGAAAQSQARCAGFRSTRTRCSAANPSAVAACWGSAT